MMDNKGKKYHDYFTLRVPILSSKLYEQLENSDKCKLSQLLENEFVYLVNCLISESCENGLVMCYETVKKGLVSVDAKKGKN